MTEKHSPFSSTTYLFTSFTDKQYSKILTCKKMYVVTTVIKHLTVFILVGYICSFILTTFVFHKLSLLCKTSRVGISLYE